MPLYFAYGSNINSDQMKSRCPNAQNRGVGILPDHQLEFSIPSKKDPGHFVANIRRATGASVHGRIWLLTDPDLDYLDALELCFPQEKLEAMSRDLQVPIDELFDPATRAMQYRREVHEAVYRATGEPVQCHVYIGNATNPHGKPSTGYWDIIAKGAQECDIPLDPLLLNHYA